MNGESPNTEVQQPVEGQDANAGASSTPGQVAPDDKGQAASSTAADGAKEPPKSSLEAVQRAMSADQAAADAVAGVDKAAGASPSIEKGGSQDGGAEKGKPDAAKPKDDDRFDKHPRFIELNTKLKAAETKAQRFDELQGWFTGFGGEPKGLGTHLMLYRLSVTEPEKGLELARRMVADLEKAVGDVLPADLQARVANGQIDEDTARELSRARQREQRHVARNDENQRERDVADARQQAADLGKRVTASVASWEQHWKTTDPDYEKLKPLVWKAIRAGWTDEGLPQTPEAAVEQAKRALKEVRDELAGLRPVQRDLNPPRGGGGSSQAKPKPKSSLEAARLAVAG